MSTDVTVAPRTGGPWTQAHWGSQIQLKAEQGSLACGPERPIDGVRFGWTRSFASGSACSGQRIEPVGTPGHTGTQLPPGGPNGQGWYVTDASFHFTSATRGYPAPPPRYPPDLMKPRSNPPRR